MNDPVYDQHIADMRAMIELYGAESTLEALRIALVEESKRDDNEFANFHEQIAELFEEVFWWIKQL